MSNNTKKVSIFHILAGAFPIAYAVSLFFLPFLTLKVTTYNDLLAVDQTERMHAALFQKLSTIEASTLVPYVLTIMLMLVATLLIYLLKNKVAYIYGLIVSTGSAMFLSFAYLKNKDDQNLFNMVFGDPVLSNGVKRNFGIGFFLAMAFALATLVFCILALREAGQTAQQAAPVRPAAGGYAAPAPQPAPGSVAAPHKIVCVSGEFMNASFPLNRGETVIIGRDAGSANVVIVAPKVSRKHCTIRFDEARNSFIVVDCSTNGTYRENGNRLMANMENPLPPGSVISLGSDENRFKLI